MTTIINTPQSPAPAQDSASGVALGVIVGAIIVIALIFFGVRYYWHAAPATNSTPTQTTVLVPSGGTTVNLSTPTTPAAPTNSTTTTNSY